MLHEKKTTAQSHSKISFCSKLLQFLLIRQRQDSILISECNKTTFSIIYNSSCTWRQVLLLLLFKLLAQLTLKHQTQFIPQLSFCLTLERPGNQFCLSRLHQYTWCPHVPVRNLNISICAAPRTFTQRISQHLDTFLWIFMHCNLHWVFHWVLLVDLLPQCTGKFISAALG